MPILYSLRHNTLLLSHSADQLSLLLEPLASQLYYSLADYIGHATPWPPLITVNRLRHVASPIQLPFSWYGFHFRHRHYVIHGCQLAISATLAGYEMATLAGHWCCTATVLAFTGQKATAIAASCHIAADTQASFRQAGRLLLILVRLRPAGQAATRLADGWAGLGYMGQLSAGQLPAYNSHRLATAIAWIHD